MKNQFTTIMLNAQQSAQGTQQSSQPQFVQDAIKLGNDAITWLIAISAVVAVGLGMWFWMKWYKADDNEKPQAMKRIQGVIIGAVAVVIFGSLLKLILSYFVH